MKKLWIVANWKSNKTEAEAKNWLQEFSIFIRQSADQFSNKEVIICPPFTLLPLLKPYIINQKFSLKIGAQDISPFDEGSYTGEINGKQIKEFADDVIIGHSERQKYFGEDQEIISQKVAQAQKNHLMPILCVQDEKTLIPEPATIVVYEPISAIGTGRPDTPENADQIAKNIKEKSKVLYVLYGGSVTSGNVSKFTQMPNLDGVLVGAASLIAKEFAEIIKNA